MWEGGTIRNERPPSTYSFSYLVGKKLSAKRNLPGVVRPLTLYNFSSSSFLHYTKFPRRLPKISLITPFTPIPPMFHLIASFGNSVGAGRDPIRSKRTPSFSRANVRIEFCGLYTRYWGDIPITPL